MYTRTKTCTIIYKCKHTHTFNEEKTLLHKTILQSSDAVHASHSVHDSTRFASCARSRHWRGSAGRRATRRYEKSHMLFPNTLCAHSIHNGVSLLRTFAALAWFCWSRAMRRSADWSSRMAMREAPTPTCVWVPGVVPGNWGWSWVWVAFPIYCSLR